MQDAFEYCERLVREADRDRFIADLFAPPKERRALHAIQAFAVEIARVHEAVRSPLPGEIRLQWWHDALATAEPGEARANPVVAALLETMERYQLPREPLLDLIDAHRFDLYDEPMPTVAELERYAARTAATPMRLAMQVLGAGDDPDLDALVGHAGIAQAITGLLRRLPRYASRRRVYLPAELLQRHGVDPADLVAGRPSAALRAVADDLRGLARGHLDAAARLARGLESHLMPALLPVSLVPAWLDRMERAGDPFRALEIAPWRRQWMLWRAARRPLGG